MSIRNAIACFAYETRDLDWGSVPDWIVAVTAVATALFAMYQLYLLRKSREDSVDAQKKATKQHQDNVKTQQGLQLMQIDNQYEGILQPSRKALLALRRRLKAKLGNQSSRNELAAAVSIYLNELRTKASKVEYIFGKHLHRKYVNDYFLITQLPNYIETMGVLVEEGLVDETALIRLYDGMIERVIGDVLPHIRWRRIQDNNPNFLIYAERLYEKAAGHLRGAGG